LQRERILLLLLLLLSERFDFLAVFLTNSEEQEGDQSNPSDATDHDPGNWAAPQSALIRAR
jgi:hypothetical protein